MDRSRTSDAILSMRIRLPAPKNSGTVIAALEGSPCEARRPESLRLMSMASHDMMLDSLPPFPKEPNAMRRRQFMETASFASAGLACHAAMSKARDVEPERIVVGVMGMSRGRDLALEFGRIPGVSVKYVCDADTRRAASSASDLKANGQTVEPVEDFRRILDDPEIHVLVCAAPNHWHGPATILACKAGKHAYVEKPASHNPQEGEWMIQAAAAHQRCVQVGTQRRSSAGYRSAMRALHQGIIGKVYLARAFYQSLRGSIGTSKDAAAPKELNFDLWQGPAPRRPYRDNVVHYNWHWFWHWGNGELGNNGIHLVDLCRWGLEVQFPTRTVSSGGRYRYVDDQQTPDTQSVAWEFDGGKQITYEGLSCVKQPGGPFVSFYGYDGYMEINGEGGYRVLDHKGKVIEEHASTGAGQPDHVANFIEAVRANDPALLNQPIASGHCSTLLCHLGNVAHRTGQTVITHSDNGHFDNSDWVDLYWRREYDPAWENAVTMV